MSVDRSLPCKPDRRRHAKVRIFKTSDVMYGLWYHDNTASWVPGTIEQQTGPVSYTVRPEGGAIVRRHIDPLQGRLASHQLVPSVMPPLRVISSKFLGTPQAEPEEAAQPLEPNEARDIEPAAVVEEPSDIEPAAVVAEPSDIEPAAVVAEPSDIEPAAVVAEPSDIEPAAVVAEHRCTARIRKPPVRLDL